MAAISVIIPVYQVEQYIRRCLDSLLAQTFSDFEAILVDDGSTDQSGAICEEYARKDPRFVVFHQKNQGQSVARNYALDWVYANSDSRYISFVDSDDWVHPKYLELLYQAATKYGVNIAQCLHLETDGSTVAPDVENRSILISPEDEYIHWYSAFFWEKLFSSSCLEHVRFPEGQIFEDVAIWYKILFAEKQLALVQETLYYYFINTSSTVRSNWKPARLAQVEAWEDQLSYIQQHCSEAVLDEALKKNCWVLKNQIWEIQESDVISAPEREQYLSLVNGKLKALLDQYKKELKRIGIYSEYYAFAYPNGSRTRRVLRAIASPKKTLGACKSGVLRTLTKPTILFESIPDFADNTRAVYDEMVRRGLDKRFHLVWDDQEHRPVFLREDGTVSQILEEKNGLSRRLLLWSLSNRTEAIICCNRVGFFVDPIKPKVFYLSHGTPIKSLHAYYAIPEYVDHALAASEAVIPICSHEFQIDEKKFFAAGFPRNDVFARPALDIRGMLHTDRSRVIVWYPTYRQHINGSKTGSANALPIIHNADAAERLDRAAREADTLIVLKPHFIQDVSLIHDLGLKNLRLIDDSFFRDNGITSYQFVNSCDALITDYSSIYFDYTLADKPIAVTWDDLEEYRRDPGFAVDLDIYMKGAVKAYDVEDLIAFVRDVAVGNDLLQAERREIRDLVNRSTDGKNAARVVDYIMDRIGAL